MVKIVAGIDVSGDPEHGNHKYMAVVIGTDEKIKSIMKKIGGSNIHMSTVKGRDKKELIVSRTSFDGRESIAFCFRIDMDRILEQIKKIRKRTSCAKLRRCYNAVLMSCVRAEIEGFLASHGCSVQDVVFQCDQDCRGIVKENGLRAGSTGPAHMLADITAWSNNRGEEPDGVISIDLTNVIVKEMKKHKLLR